MLLGVVYGHVIEGFVLHYLLMGLGVVFLNRFHQEQVLHSRVSSITKHTQSFGREEDCSRKIKGVATPAAFQIVILEKAGQGLI